MTNPSNTSPPGIRRSADISSSLSLTSHGRSLSHGTATISSHPANPSSNGDDKSISSQGARKRDKFLSLFRSTKPEGNVKTQASILDQHARAAGTEARNDINSAGSSISEAGTQPKIDMRRARLNIFSENVSRTTTKIPVPNLDARIDSTCQLALCISLLPRNLASSLHCEGLEGASDHTENAPQTMPADTAQQDWIKAIEQNPVKEDRIRWLVSRIVEEFIKDAVKNPAAVSEVILLGPVLDRALYRKLLTCFITVFETSILLDVDLLQGLVQLVQCASPTYLAADDLIKILSMLKIRLASIHQQSPEYQYHLTLAVSRLLDVMAEPEHKVQDLPRVEEREPLASVLSGLQTSSDPYLMYQALYAFQALQYVPDDESALQALMRHSLGAAESLIRVSGVIQLNFDGLLEGLKQMQRTVEETYGIAKSCYEGVSSLIDSGRGLFDSLRRGLVSGHKHPWYPAVLSATALCRAGQLKDFSKLVREAPCRPDPRFQWGVSQLLGEIATDFEWEPRIREQAVNFLGDLYLNDADWGQDDSVRSWMLAILGKISKVPDRTVRELALSFLQVPKKNDSTIVTHPYPLRSHLPFPMESPLLALVQNIPYIEYDLDSLRLQRLQEYKQTVYIPPRAKANLQASDKDGLPLMKKVKEFLESDGQVFLVLGDSGAGKSTFNRYLEHELWNEYKPGGHIPLFINLYAAADSYRDIIGEQLRIHRLSEAKIKELKENRKMILICDGYDETQLKVNLHSANMLHQKGQPDAKMIISCRSTYLGQDYRDQFHPQQSDRYSATAADLYREAVIVPFSSNQIEDYIDQFVRDPEVHKLIGDRPIWSTENYMAKLRSIPNLMELVKNPFLLTLSLRALPGVVKDTVDFTEVKVTRLTLYDSFIDQWLEISKLRLRAIKLSVEAEGALQDLLDAGFTPSAIDFLMDLSAAIFREQDGNPVVQYIPRSDKKSWKFKFFGSQSDITLLRESCPLSRTGTQHRFIHRSLLEYFYSRHVYKTQDVSSEVSWELANPLSERNLVKEPSIVRLLAEYVQGDPAFEQRLRQIIERSKTDVDSSQAASNAITILVRAGALFNRADLRGIQISGADLSGGWFDSAQMQRADLRKTNLRNVWLHQADLTNAQMADVQFGEWPYLDEVHIVRSCAYSPDGKTFAVGLQKSTISLYKIATWERTHTLSGHASDVTGVDFSPSGQQIASGSWDKTVRLWDAQTGAPGAILQGHTLPVMSVVFSPSGQQIASGSCDKTVRLWDAQTGAPGAILEGHTDNVTSVVFSPSGQQIASGSWDKTVRLWDAQTAAPGAILESHTLSVTSVVFSPSGQQIASGSCDKTVRLWDAQTGSPGAILEGHTDNVTSVVFSPSGQQIASGSFDKTVRLWDAQTVAPGAIPDGHTFAVTSAVFSPSGQQIASGSYDKTVRLWDAQTGAPGAILEGHTDNVMSVVFSPSGQQIASGSWDKTVRLWDAQTGAPGAILEGHTSDVMSVVFSPSGQQIASGSYDKTVRLWDAETMAPGAILEGHTDNVTSVVFSPSGQQIASGSWDKTVRLWDAQTGAPGAILEGHTLSVMSVVFSPSGQQIASGSWDKTVRLWDAQTGAPGAILEGHTSDVMSVVFSPSGQQIASGSWDKTLRLWDAKSYRCLAVVKGFHDAVRSISWTARFNGSYLITGCFDISVRLWQVIEDGGEYSVRLRWNSSPHRLTVSDTNIQNAQGLSRIHMNLLKQRGAVGKPISPLSLCAA